MKKQDIKKRKNYKIRLKQFRDSKKCQDCGKGNDLTLHHIIPKEVGGKSIKSNLMILCRSCHNQEHQDNHKKRWSNEDIELIILLRKQGYSHDQISEFIGRSISSVTTMVHNVKLKVDNLSNKIWKDSL